MLPAGAGALFSFFARLHTGLSYTTGREKANGILDISRFFHIWTALRQGRGPSVIGRRSRWDRRRVGPATWFPARSRAGVRYGTAYPTGGRGSYGASGRSAPGARLPGGVPISPEKWGERGPGASPLDPRFYGPLVATRSFGGCGAWFRRLSYYEAQVRALIGGLSFEEYFGGIWRGM